MNAHVPALDIEKFRKVVALLRGGGTEGERIAAKSRAEAIAAKAGLSLESALAILDSQKPSPTARGFFDGFDDWMEAREPGYKARRAAEHAEKKKQKDIRCAEIAAEYGSIDAILDRTNQEQALRGAVTHLAVWDTWTDSATGKVHPYARSLDGTEHCSRYSDLTPAIIDAVSGAYPIPTALNGVLDEHQHWRRLELDRDVAIDGEWVHYLEVQARIAVLEEELNSRPAASWDDLTARMKWWEIEINWEFSRTKEENHAFRTRVTDDFNILRSMTARGPPKRVRRDDGREPDLFSGN